MKDVSISHQRLVYAGKLLEDQSVLGDVLRLDDEVSSYTVHLVCRQTSFPKPALATATATALATESETAEGGLRRRVSAASTAAATAPTTVDATPPAATSSYPAGSGYDMASWAAIQQHMSSSAAMANSSPSSGEEQAMWMQHMYAQYMAHYMQYVQSAAMGSAYPQAAVAFMQPQPPQPAPNLDPAPPVAPGLNPGAAHLPAPDNNEEQPVIQVCSYFGSFDFLQRVIHKCAHYPHSLSPLQLPLPVQPRCLQQPLRRK